ncbi:uncharacterized protein LOC128677802 [Plodia interpunctella]|uniref:uncharacterized protein LOC128677802 n=1 Tax=Plodia interpunctella TaxID=58824 RepID=UPI0023675666|nr:uncharacterized protein LOC128677802 [Plodia interpunctella]
MKYFCAIALVSAVCSAYILEEPFVNKTEKVFFFVGDDDQELTLIDSAEEVDEVFADNYVRDPDNNGYWLYTRGNPVTPQILSFNNNSTVINSYFKKDKDTVILVHGWRGNCNSQVNTMLREAFLQALDVNVIVFDWSALAGQNYLTAKRGVPGVGQCLGQFIKWLVTLGASYERMHLVGFSLGGHLVGNAGRDIGGYVKRITALDPAGPLWLLNPYRLNKTDAQYVEVIHTTLIVGHFPPCGDADFYPNGGVFQPGCFLDSCSHRRAYELMAATVKFNHLKAMACNDMIELDLNKCYGNIEFMGNADLMPKSPTLDMAMLTSLTFALLIGFTVGLPTEILTLTKLNSTAIDSIGASHLVDLWDRVDDIFESLRFDPSVSNVYHLFTRQNPTVSQPLIQNAALIQQTNFISNRRTIVLIHGWREDALADFNTVVIPALLAAEDLNIIAVDWSEGAASINYRTVIANTISSGAAVADFISWLNQASGANLSQYHVIGHGFGGHQAGIVGRNLQGGVGYITGLDPALIGWVNNIHRFQPSDAIYTEVIHTNYGVNGYLGDLAQVDFYPNGGISMPGCDSNACDHARSYFYFAESVTSGGFTGRQCLNYYAAVLNTCNTLPGRLQMESSHPKTGRSGVYLTETNVQPPFSQD